MDVAPEELPDVVVAPELASFGAPYCSVMTG